MRVRANRSSPRRTTSPVFQRWATPSDEPGRRRSRHGAPPTRKLRSRNSASASSTTRVPATTGSSTARCGLRLVTFVVSHEASLD